MKPTNEQRRALALARYETEKARALAILRATGLETVSLEMAAAVLPDHPEWTDYRMPYARRRKS